MSDGLPLADPQFWAVTLAAAAAVVWALVRRRRRRRASGGAGTAGCAHCEQTPGGARGGSGPA